MSSTKIGNMSAYLDAVAHGYTGTREQFGKDQANFAKNAAQVAADLEESKQVLASAKTEIRTETDAQIERVAEATAEKVGEISDIGTVLYNAAMSLTDAEKGSARGNISAASAIVESASGEIITLDDSAQQPFAGMRIYGKSTQDGTPTPDAPVPIVSTGDGGSIGATVAGKNLFDFDGWCAQYNVAVTKSGNKYIFDTGVMALYSNIYYFSNQDILVKLSVTITDTTSKNVRIELINANGEVAGAVNAETAVVLVAARGLRLNWGGSGSFEIESPMVTLQEINDTSYEPYTGQSLPISTPDGLRGIPVSSGGNYTDTNGQQYVADYVDLARGVLVQRTMRNTFTGAEEWKGAYAGELFKPYASIPGMRTSSPVLCSMALEGQTVKQGYCYCGGSFNIYLVNVSTVDEWIAYLKANPMDVIVARATPIETPLTAEEIAAYRALMTNHGYTTIYNDAGAHMDVDYAANTKLYIDKKIAALSAAILENNA